MLCELAWSDLNLARNLLVFLVNVVAEEATQPVDVGLWTDHLARLIRS